MGAAGTSSWIIQASTPGNQQVNVIYKGPGGSITGTEGTLHSLSRSSERHFRFSDPIPFLIFYSMEQDKLRIKK
jgi:hypothetical protein